MTRLDTRQDYLAHVRAAEEMRADARAHRAIADSLAPIPAVYGQAAVDYAAGQAERYRIIANFSDWQAEQQEEYADDLRAQLVGEA